MNSFQRPRSLFWPLLLIAVGIVLLLNQLRLIPGSSMDIFWRLWPLLFIVGGLDNLWKRESIAGGILLIGLGTIFLLANLGYLALSGWNVLVRFWPVLLIAFGLDILIGRRSAAATIIGTLVGFALIAGMVWFLAVAPAGQAAQATALVQTLDGAQSASIQLDQPVGKVQVTTGAESKDLLSGELYLHGSKNSAQTYSVSDGRGIYHLKNEGVEVFYPTTRDEPRLELRLNSQVPLDLESKLAVGEQRVNLANLNLASVDLETVIGRSEVFLPGGSSFPCKVQVVIGELIIMVPRSAAVRIHTDTGLTAVNLPSGYARQGDWIVSPGAENAADRIELNVNIPMGMLRVETVGE